MIKVAMIGAGSVVFSKNLTGDILSFPEFADATLSYMDVDADRLEVGASLCRKVGKALGATPTIEATPDRRQAIDGADFVICMVQIGGFDSTLVDFEIPRKYGLNFTIADTTGPGGLFRALRTFPLMRDMARDIAEVASPNCWLLNYSNPMSMNMLTLTHTHPGVNAVGLCHSVQHTRWELARDLGMENGDEIDFVCAGINHMAFYLKFSHKGEDLYPRLFEIADRQIAAKKNAVRYELMKRLGSFVTESSEHNAEYCAHFIPHGRELVERFNVPIDEYLRRCDGILDEFERLKAFAKTDEPIVVRKSHEYGSEIIHSVSTGKPRVVYGNMPNRGAIANLPHDAIAEMPTLVDANGCRFTTVGTLPPQLIGYMNPHVTQQELFIRAATEGRRDHVYQAAMFDPLTAATLPTDRIVEMCDELIAAHGFVRDGGVLPDLDAKKTLVPTSGRTFDPPTPRQLRESWDTAHRESRGDIVRHWHVAGPFKGQDHDGEGVDLRTPVEPDDRPVVDLSATYASDGTVIAWRPAETVGLKGLLNLSGLFGPLKDAVAYAYAEVESVAAREAVLSLGSDDGVVLWVNGEQVHRKTGSRPFRPDDDKVTVHLNVGINRLLVKVHNIEGAWGVGVSMSRPNF